MSHKYHIDKVNNILNFDFYSEFEENDLNEYKIGYNDLYRYLYYLAVNKCHSDIKVNTYKSIFDDKESGIRTKLKRLLNFDTATFGCKSNKDKFEELQFLKFIYDIEKIGEPISKCRIVSNKTVTGHKDGTKLKLPLIDILSNPSLGNINIGSSDNGFYEEFINEILSVMNKKVTDYQTRIEVFDKIDSEWRHLQLSLMQTALLNDTIERISQINHLNEISYQFDEFITNNLYYSNYEEAHENIWEAFYNILLHHKYLSLISNEQKSMYSMPEYKYTKMVRKKYCNLIMLKKVTLNEFKNIIRTNSKNPDLKNNILCSIFYIDSPTEAISKYNEKKREFKNAVKYANDVAQLYYASKKSDEKMCLTISGWVDILQEIIYLQESELSYTYKYVRSGNQKSIRKLYTDIKCLKTSNPIGKNIINVRIFLRNRFNVCSRHTYQKSCLTKNKLITIQQQLHLNSIGINNFELNHKCLFYRIKSVLITPEQTDKLTQRFTVDLLLKIGKNLKSIIIDKKLINILCLDYEFNFSQYTKNETKKLFRNLSHFNEYSLINLIHNPDLHNCKMPKPYNELINKISCTWKQLVFNNILLYNENFKIEFSFYYYSLLFSGNVRYDLIKNTLQIYNITVYPI